MKRDYANRFQAKTAKKTQGGRWLWSLTLLLLLALLVGMLTVKHHHQTLLLAKQQKVATAPPPVSKKPAAPQFDFYNILSHPKQLTTLQNNTPAIIPTPMPLAVTTTTDTAKPGYLLQVAAFRQADVAQTIKTQLAVAGFSVRLTTTPTGWIKVMSGPYAKKEDALRDQQKLQKRHFSPLLLG